MFIPTKIIAKLKHKSKIFIKQINYKGLIMQVSFWNNQFFIKMTLKLKFKNVEKFTFYSCFWISLQIHNWDKCCHLVPGKAFVYKRQNAIHEFTHSPNIRSHELNRHCQNSVWCLSKMEKLDYWRLVNFFIATTIHSILFLLDRHQTACSCCQLRKYYRTKTTFTESHFPRAQLRIYVL